MNNLTKMLAAGAIALSTIGLTVASSAVLAEEPSLADRMLHHRAIDAAVWAMPLMNFKFYRDGLADAGVGRNDVGYFSKLQDWRMQTATPNNTTPYILTYWNFKDGPVVVEIPPSAEGIGIFGTRPSYLIAVEIGHKA